jgi:hypothetical protein
MLLYLVIIFYLFIYFHYLLFYFEFLFFIRFSQSLAITDFDIYEWEESEAVIMGRGTGDRVGVFSFYRYDTTLASKPKLVLISCVHFVSYFPHFLYFCFALLFAWFALVYPVEKEQQEIQPRKERQDECPRKEAH